MVEQAQPTKTAEARSEQDEPLRLQELNKEKNDPDPKALACYGMLEAESYRMHLRFAEGRPVSQVTTDLSSVVVTAASRHRASRSLC